MLLGHTFFNNLHTNLCLQFILILYGLIMKCMYQTIDIIDYVNGIGNSSREQYISVCALRDPCYSCIFSVPSNRAQNSTIALFLHYSRQAKAVLKFSLAYCNEGLCT